MLRFYISCPSEIWNNSVNELFDLHPCTKSSLKNVSSRNYFKILAIIWPKKWSLRQFLLGMLFTDVFKPAAYTGLGSHINLRVALIEERTVCI